MAEVHLFNGGTSAVKFSKLEEMLLFLRFFAGSLSIHSALELC